MSVNWLHADLDPIFDGLQEHRTSGVFPRLHTIGYFHTNLKGPAIKNVSGQILQFKRRRKCGVDDLNRVFSGILGEVKARCKRLCIQDVYFQQIDCSGAREAEPTVQLVTEFGKQAELLDEDETVHQRAEHVADCFVALFQNTLEYCDEAINLVNRQNAENRLNPIFFLTKRQAKHSKEDVVEVSSTRMGQFVCSFIDNYDLLLGRELVVGGHTLSLAAPSKLAVEAMNSPAATREEFKVEKVSVRHYEQTLLGDHAFGLPGWCLGLRVALARGVVHPDLVFTDDFRRDAVTGANVKKLSDLTGRDADIRFRKIFKRFAYSRSYATSVLIEHLGGISRPNKCSFMIQQNIDSLVRQTRYRERALQR